MISRTLCTSMLLSVFLSPCFSTTFLVGPTRTYKKPSEVMGLVDHGDTVLIDAGEYLGDVGFWTKNNLVIQGVGGYAHLRADGQHAGGKAIWVVQGNNTLIEWIEFSEVSVPDENGAGIRQEGDDVTIRYCYFHDSEEGILAGNNSNSTIRVEYSIFHDNGFGNGFTHNIYVNKIDSFIFQYNYVHHAIVGHNVKTRAYNNIIRYNRIMDESDGNASYQIDMSNGGNSFVVGNLIQQSPSASNSSIVRYGAEGLSNPVNNFYCYNNTIVNERHTGIFVNINSANDTAVVFNNIFLGVGTTISGSSNAFNNMHYTDPNDANLVDYANYDYHLTDSSGAIDQGADPVAMGLLPVDYEYEHSNDKTDRPELPPMDVGAYEFSTLMKPYDMWLADNEINLHPNGTENIYEIKGTTSAFVIQILDENENVFRTLTSPNDCIEVDISALPAGMFFIAVTDQTNPFISFTNILKDD